MCCNGSSETAVDSAHCCLFLRLQHLLTVCLSVVTEDCCCRMKSQCSEETEQCLPSACPGSLTCWVSRAFCFKGFCWLPVSPGSCSFVSLLLSLSSITCVFLLKLSYISTVVFVFSMALRNVVLFVVFTKLNCLS